MDGGVSLLVTGTRIAVFFAISVVFYTSNFVCFLLGKSPAPEFYMPTFRNTLFHLNLQVDYVDV